MGRTLLKNEIEDKEQGASNAISSLLIVDDSPIIVDRLRELLEDMVEVSTVKWCYTYSDAMYTIDSFRPNVVLLDINLAGRSGLDLLQYIKTYLINTIVIMVSNQNSEYYKQICFELGADYFVDKANDFYQIPDILALFNQPPGIS